VERPKVVGVVGNEDARRMRGEEKLEMIGGSLAAEAVLETASCPSTASSAVRSSGTFSSR
jgi:hypothetical protein